MKVPVKQRFKVMSHLPTCAVCHQREANYLGMSFATDKTTLIPMCCEDFSATAIGVELGYGQLLISLETYNRRLRSANDVNSD